MTYRADNITEVPDSCNDANGAGGERAVLATVAYSDIFDMPIDAPAVHRFLVRMALEPDQTAQVLERLVASGRLIEVDGLFHLPGRGEVIGTHRDRTRRAAEMWRHAETWGRRIGRLPFVRMVAVTGGLAVDSVADHDDIDYFIVTRIERLWLTRLAVVALGRAARFGGVELCPNYLVSERALEMRPHSAYVARELAQMVVIVGPETCAELWRRNSWMFEYLPNAARGRAGRPAADGVPGPLRRLVEWVLLRRPFDAVEGWEMRRKVARLRRVPSRHSDVATPDESAFSPDVCKGHMEGNAAGIERAWDRRLACLEGEPAP